VHASPSFGPRRGRSHGKERRNTDETKENEEQRGKESKKKKGKRSFVAVPSVDEGKGSEKERAHVCVNARRVFFAAA